MLLSAGFVRYCSEFVLRQFILFLFCAFLSSCSRLKQPEIAGLPTMLPLAAPMAPARRVLQQITASWQDRQDTLLCVLELDARRIAMAGLSPDGLSLFNLSYDGTTVNADKSPLLPETVAPAFIIADVQLIYWPLAELRKILPFEWRLEANEQHRSLYYKQQKKVEVNYLSPDAVWPKAVELINYQYNYRLHIKTLSYGALSE